MITQDFCRQWVPATESIVVQDVRPPGRTSYGVIITEAYELFQKED